MSPSHFPPSVPFWGWFGVAGLFFYGVFPFAYRKLPWFSLGGSLFSLAGVLVTLWMLLLGPLSWEMGAIHLSGDVAGLIGFGYAAVQELRDRRNPKP